VFLSGFFARFFSKLNPKNFRLPENSRPFCCQQFPPKTQQNFKTQPNFRKNSTKSAPKLNSPEVLPTFAPLKNALQKSLVYMVQL